MAATVWDWLGANSDAIKAMAALVAIPGALWGCYLGFKKLRGLGLDDQVNHISDKADRLLLENRLLRHQTTQVRRLIEQVLLKLEPEALTPALIENIEHVAKMAAGQEEKRRVEIFATQLRQQTPGGDSLAGLSQGASDSPDPLAELAHLIGRIDPFADLGSNGMTLSESANGVERVAKTVGHEERDPLGELARIIGKIDPFATNRSE